MKNTPKLRFPEFLDDGEWEEKKLKELAKNLDNKRIPITSSARFKGDIPYYGASGIVDFVNDYIFDEELLCISEDGANLVVRTYPIAFSISGKTWVNNHAHVLKFNNKYTQVIVENYINSIKLDDFLTGMAQPKLNKAMLDIIPIPIASSTDEQQKIADCLSSVDSLISAQSKKVELLKEHKKGLLQNLFPREGESVPRLRFPEFLDDGEWEEMTLIDISDFINQKISIDKLTLNNYISTENLLQDFSGVAISSKLPDVKTVTHFKENDILISNIRPYLKKVWSATFEGGASNDVIVVRAKENINNNFLTYVLKNEEFINYVMQGAKGVKMPRGDISLIKKYPLFISSEPKEQQKIANFLSSIDELITSSTKKIETLKEHKKALMQQLFPSKEVQ